MEKLAELPPWALVTFCVALAFIVAVRYFGVAQGQKAVPADAASFAQVATIIVDPTALNNATAAVRQLSDTLAVVTKQLAELVAEGQEKQEDHAHMICRRIEALSEEVDALGKSISAMTLEMVRKR